MNKNMTELEERIGYSFTKKSLLENALTHSSYVNESKNRDACDNERLEFFGDAIIEFHVSEYLYEHYKNLPEGDLTKLRASMVCESGLAVCAKTIGLGDYILMGKGEEMSGGRERASITSDAFEALTAAIYLDSGKEKVKEFIHEFLLKSLENKELFFDAKTRLQEIIQKDNSNVLQYELLEEKGPVHDRIFIAGAFLNGEEIGRGEGHSKKQAQQNAASDAISRLKKVNQ